MKTNNRDFIRGDGNNSSSTAAIQEIQGMGAGYLLATNEEELCEYLVTKYQNAFPLNDDRKQEFQHDHRLLADAIRQNVVKRKANFFGRLTNSQDTQITRRVA